MNILLFVNANISFSENLFLVFITFVLIYLISGGLNFDINFRFTPHSACKCN